MITRTKQALMVAALSVSIVGAGCESAKEAGAAIGALGGAAIGYFGAKAAGADDGTAIAVAVGGAIAGGIIGYQVGKYIEKRRAEDEEKRLAEREYAERQQRLANDERLVQQTKTLEEYSPPPEAPNKRIATEVKPNTWVLVDPQTGVAGDDAYVLAPEDSAKLRETGQAGQLATIGDNTVAVNTR